MFSKLKQWLKSKFINTGLALMIFGSLELNFHLLKEYIPEQWYGAIFVALGLLVVVLRFFTVKPLNQK